ncbi:MAG: hypothetical protein JST80_03800 [Bdellovibrionales bacterium]|nr:hypothetical protein [Bdellovibrionales bacterium]
MTVIDMQTGNIQVADFDNSRNVLDIGNANSLPAVLARASMMTFSVKKGFDYKPDPNRGSDMMNDVFKDALTIEFTTRPQIKRSYLPEGVNAPLIKFKVILMPWRDGVFEQRGDHTVWTSNPSSKPKSIYIALAGISAVSEPSASLAQKVFNSGVQFGVDLLAKLTLGRFSSPNWDDVDYFAKMAGESLDAAQ